MELTEARNKSLALLNTILENQPNLFINSKTAIIPSDGKSLAEFCSTFIESYSNYLMNLHPLEH